MKLFRTALFFVKWCSECIRDILLCALWFGLIGLLAVQVGVATSHQLPMPDWMLRRIEAKVATAGLRLQIDNASVDPTGRVLLKNLRLSSDSIESPLVRVDTLYLRLNPFALLAKEIEPIYIRATGLNLLLPAMLSPTGRTEAVLSNVCFSFKPNQDNFSVDQLSGQLANLTFSARGSITVPAAFKLDPRNRTNPSALVAEAIKQYIEIARKLSELAPELAALESPYLDLSLTSDSAVPTLAVTLTSRRADIDLTRFRPDAGRLLISDLNLATSFGLSSPLPTEYKIHSSFTQVHTTTGYDLQGVKTVLTAAVSRNPSTFKPLELLAAIESAVFNNITLKDSVARLVPGQKSVVSAELTTEAIGTSWQLAIDADPKPGRGTIALKGAITPFIVRQIEAKAGMRADSLLKLSAPAPVALIAEFSDGWALRKVRGQFSFGPLVAHTVPLTAGRANISFDGTELFVTEIIASQGENATEGSYWMNAKTKDFRFLLNGHLRPLGIAGWFESWWPNFFRHFDFSASPPAASVEVAGRWGVPRGTTVFVTADVARPTIRNVFFDRVRTTMFIRPDFYDALELIINRGDQTARGTFTRVVDLDRASDALRSLDFDITSNLDLAETTKIFGTEGEEIVEPFKFANPPSLHLVGHVDGAASVSGPHRAVQISVKSTGGFSLYDFPLDDLSFDGTIKDRDIDLRGIQVSFARGEARGKAFLSGTEEERRLSFDVALTGANLGEAISTFEQFTARQRGEPPVTNSRFQQKIADGRLNLKLAAQGFYRNPLSYQGQGEVELNGAQLAQINLLGALSQVLNKSPLFNFTSLQLNDARSSFTVDHEKLDFPNLRITGSTAMIDAKGSFSLDKKAMDFGAKVYPFGQGKTLLANAVGFVLVPLSNALELKLSGALDQPNWRFAYGPTSFIYNITGTKPRDAALPDQVPIDITHRLPPPYLRR